MADALFYDVILNESQTNQSHLLLPTIERGEDIFGQLENFKNEYNEWVLPAQVRFQIDTSYFLTSATIRMLSSASRDWPSKHKASI